MDLAVTILSRYILAVRLLPVLKVGGGTIISIQAAGMFNTFDRDDLKPRVLKSLGFFGNGLS